jgi:glycyl-tRNA synthetase beta chain
MRWGDGQLRWVRPLHGIVAIFGEEIVPVDIDSIQAAAATLGHRFHHPGPITIGGPHDYVEKLRACHVIVDHDERESLIREGTAEVASAAGLTLLPDEGLVVENAGLTEWPVPLLGRFDADFLDVPSEIIVLTMRTNQKYFACTNDEGLLASAFVCVANIEARDHGEAIVEGNARVLEARLADARFFWEQDLKSNIDELSERLNGVVYFQGLGTYAEKQYRVEFLVENLSADLEREDIKGLWPTSTRSKVDLVTATVGEFPELQGVIGSYLLERSESVGEKAYALKGLYRTAQEITASPADGPTNLLQLADRLDNIVAFASVGVWFKGSGDPYGIRQSAQAVIAALLKSSFRISLRELIWHSYRAMLNSFSMNRNLFAVETLTGRAGQTREIETPVSGAGLPDQSYQDFESFKEHSFRAKPATVEQLRANGFVDWAIERMQRYYTDEIPSIRPYTEIESQILGVLIDRLKVQQRDAGVRHDLIDAVFSLGGEDDLVRLLARVGALQSFVETEDGSDLLIAYNRAAKILKKENWTGPQVLSSAEEQGIPQTGEEDPLVLVEEPGLKEAIAEIASGEAGADLPQEKALIAALDKAEPKASAAVDKEDFTGAMAALASLRKPIDDFFDHVTVNDPDSAKRERRLNLLMRFRDAVNCVADFSKIEG